MALSLYLQYPNAVEPNIESLLTSPEEMLDRADKQEQAILAVADNVLAVFFEKVVIDASDGNITRGAVVAYWTTSMTKALSHPTFANLREPMLEALETTAFADDVFTAAQMAVEVAQNMGATPAERLELLTALFAHPEPSLIASLSKRLDGWLRRRISKQLRNRLRKLGPDDLSRDDLVGREFEIPESPGTSTLVTEDDWPEGGDQPGGVNWRARMHRDIRTAYTGIFGRQMQYQLERYGFIKKRWVSRQDERVRLSHRHANGDTVGIQESFTVGKTFLRFPGDPLGPAGEVINCRCVIVGAGRR